MVTETFSILGLENLLMSHKYGFSSSNRTRMPFNDLQVSLNDQFYFVSNLFTGIWLCWITLSYNSTILSYSDLMNLARSG